MVNYATKDMSFLKQSLQTKKAEQFGLVSDIREVAEGENPNPFRRGAAYFGVFRYSAQPEPFRSARRTFFTSRAIACCNFESFDSGGKTK